MAQCFGFSEREKLYLFALFNHESSFILNNRSVTGARCYGQLTGIAIEEVSNRIRLSRRLPVHWGSQIYLDVKKKCTDLRKSLHLPRIRVKTSKNKKGQIKEIVNLEDFRQANCQMSHHAPTCLFYAMYTVRLQKEYIPHILNSSHNSYKVRKKIPRHLKKDFQLPIKLNEVLIVKGTFKEGGRSYQRQWVVKDDKQLYNLFYNSKTGKRRRGYDKNSLQLGRVPLVKINKLDEWGLVYSAYNGGPEWLNKKMRTLLEYHKDRLVLGDLCERKSQHPYCTATNLRRQQSQLREGESLSFSLKEFTKNFRKTETKAFKRKIQVQRDYLNPRKDSLSPSALLHQLEQLHTLSPGRTEKERTIEPPLQRQIVDFVKNISNRCLPNNLKLPLDDK